MFVRGGYVDPGDILGGASLAGFYWSSVSYNNHYTYYLTFNSSSILPSYNNYRYNGYSIRCAALGG